MAENNDFTMNYRRYAAQKSSMIKPDKTPDKPSSEERKEPAPAEEKKILAPVVRMRQLQSKLDDNIDDLNALNELLRIGYELEEYQLIEDYMREYLARHPRHHATRHSLAVTLIRLGNKRRAKVELRKILSQNPKFKRARQLLERMRKNEI